MAPNDSTVAEVRPPTVDEELPVKKNTRILSTATIAVALTLGGLATNATAANAAEDTSTNATSPALIQGPLVQGPLIDIGGILDSLRIGQFQ
ncbi:hypothetical protein BIU95_06080 [Curtobacterium sp. MCBA15_007]|nr:hypothetical protein H489_0107415 [Curtobacterium flaccumfaciens UCD-AKU]KIQ10488.1 hypothetical protein RU06_05570 [Curtobacterium flaccumfaciens]KQR31368.1 hypothetical protein ASF75_08125 [Curtobacterium sp. Leaf154]OII02308.1 hypothetical protein BIU95_06080 [Curtobacterium sp. MCBA15_007]TPG06309.1 hypothetical protein EAH85_12265 [Curtobacterium flaccumfaciens]